ncbi:carbohydrate kinase [uncultured Amphritea sp.]|mgnify:CR=1 FL=1|uniref:carbohydrate kinase family protein n=1 Tax=uncultured Amphritea sp. TaxID=981605 RepID=UPI002637A7AE|nr:carbohydrate kinase [uncultured Amphritea sp.]
MDKIISFGEALVDMLSTRINNQHSDGPEAFIKFPGGAPANVAAAVGKLGGRSYFAGKVGKDMFGDFMRESLQDANVNTDYLLSTSEANTALAFVSLDHTGERSFEFYRNPSADLFFQTAEFKSDWFSEPGIFHFCSNTLTHETIETTTNEGIDKAKKAGFMISFDINLRLNLWPNNRDPLEPIWQCIKKSDIIKLSAEELDFFCSNHDENDIINKMLFTGVSLIIITDGGEKLRFYTQNRQGEISPPKVTMVDSTAAGDAFIGGLLFSLAKLNISSAGIFETLKIPELIEETLRFACRCGAHAVTKKGAFTSLPTHSDLII